MSDRRKVSPMTAALMLSAILATAAQPVMSTPTNLRQPAARAGSPQRESTRTNAPTNQQTQRQQARVIGPDPNPNRRRNPMRQVRRLFERMGWITSGRQWRNFRKLAHRDPFVASLIQNALKMTQAQRNQAIRLARTGAFV